MNVKQNLIEKPNLTHKWIKAPEDVVRYGNVVYLKNKNGHYFTTAYRGSWPRNYFWPQLNKRRPVRLKLLGGRGKLNVTHLNSVKIKSTESGLGDYNILGAWGNSSDCYYWIDGYDEKKQGWQIVTVDGIGVVHYRDKVQFINRHYTNQRLVPDTHWKGYVTTKEDFDGWWTLEKGI